jgi:leader peptidase (prepilin peptidase)/N-methyltransferase
MTPPWIIAAAVLGFAAGPRIRVVSFARSASRDQPPQRSCPACARDILPAGHQFRSLALPLASARCPGCHARIGPPPLTVEVLTALVFAALAVRATSPWELAALAWLAGLAVPLALIDVAVHRLPDRLTAAALLGTLVLLAAAAIAGHDPGRLGRAALGGAALTCFYLVLAGIRPAGMGLGDVKFAASVGTALGWFGWQEVLTGTFISFILAGLCGVVLLALHRVAGKDQLPFGPFIAIGALAAIALG